VPEGSRETVRALAEIVPNVLIGRHTHPGPEVSYVLEGELTLMVQGQPDKTLKAGDTFQNSGRHPARRALGPERRQGAGDLRGREGQAARLAGAVARLELLRQPGPSSSALQPRLSQGLKPGYVTT
jgi:hypothetical protein